jgi:hypothetical protein
MCQYFSNGLSGTQPIYHIADVWYGIAALFLFLLLAP